MWDDAARRKAGLTGGLGGAALGKNVTPYAYSVILPLVIALRLRYHGLPRFARLGADAA